MLSVEQVYDKIAAHFDVSRQRVWGSVKQFLSSLPTQSAVLDIGCGNGKNMLFRKDLLIKGIDISNEQVKICQKKNLTATVAPMTNLPFPSNTFDNMLCIATYHHLDNDTERQKALQEMYRCLKPNGQVLITVWAMEQHTDSTFRFSKSDELVPWTMRNGETFYRYYHIYKMGELLSEVNRLCPAFTHKQNPQVGWELGNWYIILTKTLIKCELYEVVPL
jgi:ubiquinone/menaquinone biosynthesis C-methylase UbiE